MFVIFLLILGLIASLIGVNVWLWNKKTDSDLSKIGRFTMIGGISFMVFIWLLFSITITSAGTVKVVETFGEVDPIEIHPGVSFLLPWQTTTVFSTRKQELKETMATPSTEGLEMGLEVSLIFRLKSSVADEIYVNLGENYINNIILPNFRSVVRGISSKYEAKALYTSDREIVQRELLNELAPILELDGILLESVPVRRVGLPPKLSEAIEFKLKAEQESQQMKFILEKEEQEAERKRIEAKGIQDFQTIVSKGINENLLRWKGIEATEKLAGSENSKVVVIGSSKDGLPLILGK